MRIAGARFFAFCSEPEKGSGRFPGEEEPALWRNPVLGDGWGRDRASPSDGRPTAVQGRKRVSKRVLQRPQQGARVMNGCQRTEATVGVWAPPSEVQPVWYWDSRFT